MAIQKMIKTLVILSMMMILAVIAQESTPETKDSRFENPLLRAADLNDFRMLKMIIERGANVNQEDRGILPLHLAIRNLNLEMVNFLLSVGADPNISNPSGESSGLLAIISGDEEIIKAVLNSEKLNVNYETPFGYNAVHVVGQYGSVEALKIFEARGFTNWNGGNEFQDAPIHLALKFGQRDAAKYLIRKPEVEVETPNNVGWTPFLLAAIDGDVSIVRYLKEDRKVNDKVTNNDGETALHRAIQHMNNDVAAYLVEELGHEIDSVDKYGWTPLHFSVFLGNVDGFVYLVEQGADPLRRTSEGHSIFIINERSKHTKKATKDLFEEKFTLLFSEDPVDKEDVRDEL